MRLKSGYARDGGSALYRQALLRQAVFRQALFRQALFRQAVFQQALFRQALFRQAVFQYGTIPRTRLFNYQFLILVYKQMFTITSFALLPIC